MEANESNTIQNNMPTKDRKGFAIAALVLGIVSTVLSCNLYISVPCGILAIIFGFLSLKSSKRGFSIAGLITGIVGVTITILITVIAFALGMGILKTVTDVVLEETSYSTTKDI